MTTSIQKFFIAITLLVAISSATSCKKDTFDEPPGNTTDPNLDTISISRLKAYYTGGSPVSIPDDVTIAGIVIADDKTGNFYKSIVIDDGNAAIALSIDVSSGLYTDYPVGRKIYVKCQGLALGTYGGTPQLGGYVDGASVGRIAQALLPKIIVKGPIGNDVTPLIQHVHISQLNDSYLSRLIQLDTVEFQAAFAGIPYADVNKAIPDDGNRTLTDCDNKTIVVRTSPYCTFAFANTPTGNGTMLGIYTKYNSTKQFTIRDTTDVNMNGTKCDGSTPTDTLPGAFISIASLRAMYTVSSGIQVLGTAYKIRGIVITDRANKNENDKNLIIQDGTAGIIVRFSDNHTFNVGDDITIAFAATDSLKKFSGALQAGGLTPLLNATKLGTGSITPQTVTVSTLIANFSDYESELIKIVNVSLTETSGGSNTSGTYGYSKLFANDGASIQLFTSSTALFKNSTYPTGVLSNIVAYAIPFNSTKEIKIRNTADVTP